MPEDTESDEQENGAEDIDIEENVMQAQQAHQQLDQFKAWASETATTLRTMADLMETGAAELDHDPDELRQAANVVQSLHDRIEQGDSGRARQVQQDG
jgi:hypothetical protein